MKITVHYTSQVLDEDNQLDIVESSTEVTVLPVFTKDLVGAKPKKTSTAYLMLEGLLTVTEAFQGRKYVKGSINKID